MFNIMLCGMLTIPSTTHSRASRAHPIMWPMCGSRTLQSPPLATTTLWLRHPTRGRSVVPCLKGRGSTIRSLPRAPDGPRVITYVICPPPWPPCACLPQVLPAELDGKYRNPCWTDAGRFRCIPYFQILGAMFDGIENSGTIHSSTLAKSRILPLILCLLLIGISRRVKVRDDGSLWATKEAPGASRWVKGKSTTL